jgi:hypothetical protein
MKNHMRRCGLEINITRRNVVGELYIGQPESGRAADWNRTAVVRSWGESDNGCPEIGEHRIPVVRNGGESDNGYPAGRILRTTAIRRF